MNDFTDSDQHWLEVLRGRDAGTGTAAAGGAGTASSALEARALRRALALDAARADQADAGARDHADARERRYQQLRFRLRQERIELVRKPAIRRWSPAVGLVAAMFVAVVAVQQPPMEPTVYDAPPAVRGAAHDQALHRYAARAQVERWAAALKAREVPGTVFQSGQTFVLAFQVDGADALQAARDVLAPDGIDPQPGFNRIAVSRAWWQRFSWQ